MEEKKLWYVVNAYSGHEQKVKDYLESRRESMGMENNIFRVIIPERTEIEVKDGVKKEKDLADTQKYLDSPFPSKEIPNKTFRKLRIR